MLFLLTSNGDGSDFHSAVFKGRTSFHRFGSGILQNQQIGFPKITFLYFVVIFLVNTLNTETNTPIHSLIIHILCFIALNL